MINPTGNTGSREVPNLLVASAPELYDLQMRMIKRDPLIKEESELFSERLFPLYRNDPFTGDGEFKTITELTTKQYGSEQPEGTKAQMTKFGIGRTFSFTYVDYGEAYTASKRALENLGNHPTIMRAAINLPVQLMNRRYIDGVHRFTFGDVSSYTNMSGRVVDVTGIDGLAIFHTAHTLPHSTTTWSNKLGTAVPLAKAGVIAALDLFNTDIKDGFGGNRIGSVDPDTIIIAKNADMQYTATQLFRSSTELGQANAGVINALPEFKIVVLPKLNSDANGNIDSAKNKWWIMGKFGQNGTDMRFCSRHGITVSPVQIATDTSMSRVFHAYTAYAFVVVSGKGMVLSPVA